MGVRGGDEFIEILLPPHQESVLGSATEWKDVLMAGTAGQSMPQLVANARAALSPGASLQGNPRPGVQVSRPAAEPQVMLPNPEESRAEAESHQGENRPNENLVVLIEDIVFAAVDEAVAAATAEDHARRQADEVVQDIIAGLVEDVIQAEEQERHSISEAVECLVSSLVDAVVVAAETRDRHHEASIIVENISGVVLEIVAAALHPDPPQSDDDPPHSTNSADLGSDATDWSMVEMQDDADEEVVLLTDPINLEEDAEHVTEVTPMGQLDGADEMGRRGVVSKVVSRLSRTTGSGTVWTSVLSMTTGSGTVWTSVASGVTGTVLPRPQTEELLLGPITRAQRRLMARGGDGDI